ncbi:hypothetical protein SAMN05421736_10373 [Evansella caseinilytica]|uniref:Uncharacterized protein n=1 Tax=Evansella caseinilytica TaxID=1503961 RepID=A0A1H3LZX5_9BACI|nr:hypothetical protein SAMN05421736_10373 [Evansella caseinilytica]
MVNATQRRDSQSLYPGLFEQPQFEKKFKKEDITAARRSRRGSIEQRSVHGTYVSSGEATQRGDSQSLYPGLFEQPQFEKKFKKEDITAARRSRRGSIEQRSVHGTYVSSGEATQRGDSQSLYPGLFEHPQFQKKFKIRFKSLFKKAMVPLDA